MFRPLIAALVLALQVPVPLSEMADAERAFARRASQLGVRDSFLEFFADDAVRFDEQPSAAKPFLEKLKPQPPSVVESCGSHDSATSPQAATSDISLVQPRASCTPTRRSP